MFEDRRRMYPAMPNQQGSQSQKNKMYIHCGLILTQFRRSEFGALHSIMVDKKFLLAHDVASLGTRVQTFRSIVAPLYSSVLEVPEESFHT